MKCKKGLENVRNIKCKKALWNVTMAMECNNGYGT